MDIICLGELLVDMFPAELGRGLVDVTAFRPKPGGAPANVAVAATRLGAQSAFIGKVGEDAFGHHLADVLEGEGVDIRGIRFDEKARTTMAFIAMPDENTAEFVFYRNPGADMMLRVDELDLSLLRETRAFHFGSISLIEEPSRSATLEAIRVAKKTDALISFDANYRPNLWPSPEEARTRLAEAIPYADLLKVNEVEIALLSGSRDLHAASASLLECGPTLCVVTLGPEGSYFRIGDGGEHVPPFRVDTVDATGCGDAFVAGLLCQLVVESDWREHLSVPRMRAALRYANAVGALTSLTLGVIPALPTKEQVDEFLAQHHL
jgi:fructokinase